MFFSSVIALWYIGKRVLQNPQRLLHHQIVIWTIHTVLLYTLYVSYTTVAIKHTFPETTFLSFFLLCFFWGRGKGVGVVVGRPEGLQLLFFFPVCFSTTYCDWIKQKLFLQDSKITKLKIDHYNSTVQTSLKIQHFVACTYLHCEFIILIITQKVMRVSWREGYVLNNVFCVVSVHDTTVGHWQQKNFKMLISFETFTIL